MKFRIDPAIFSSFPGLHIGVIRARGLDNHGDCPELTEKVEKLQAEIRERFGRERLSDYPKIQNWRDAYAFFGAKPKKHRSSVENLYRMTLEAGGLRSINKLVDIYNYVSLARMIPIGGDDLDRVEGSIELRFAAGDEPFRPLGSQQLQRARMGEVIYADEKEVLCRRWNWRESDKTKMTEQTRDVLLVCEGLPPVTHVEMEKIVNELARLVKEYCGGMITRDVLDGDKSEWEFEKGGSIDTQG